jgi:integrase
MKGNKRNLTDMWLQARKPLPRGRRETTWDSQVPGLCIRHSQKVAFYVYKRPKGRKQKWVYLGDYPVLGLAVARAKARHAINAIEGGWSPSAAAHNTDEGTFSIAAERFMQECLNGKRTRDEIEQIFRSKLIPVLGTKRLSAITPGDIKAVLRKIADKTERAASGRIKSGGPHAAKKTLTYLHGMLRWCAYEEIDGLQDNPARAINATDLLRGKEFNRHRERTLGDAELRVIWRRAEELGYPFGTLIRALSLTGQRLSEIADLSWSEIRDNQLHIPGERMKNKREHILPLTTQMQELVEQLPRGSAGDYLFSTTNGKRPISGFGKYKRRFDEGLNIEPWQIHDIRRTVRTNLSKAQVPVFEAELIIAHQQSGVHGVYDKHRYNREKLNGLEKWEQLLTRIIDPPANVMELRKAL